MDATIIGYVLVGIGMLGLVGAAYYAMRLFDAALRQRDRSRRDAEAARDLVQEVLNVVTVRTNTYPELVGHLRGQGYKVNEA
jgi:hypothetical protein